MIRMDLLLAVAVTIMHIVPLSAQENSSEAVSVVSSVDLERYCGTWHEIARLPNRFQDECECDVTATYTLLEEGELEVVNRCRDRLGDTIKAVGRAKRASEEEPNSKLKVRFAPAILSFLPFVWGDYWILGLADDYSWAIVGDPEREYLWILSRSPSMPETRLKEVISIAAGMGYNVAHLIWTKQSEM